MKGATSALSSCKVSSIGISLSQQVQYFHGFAETFDSLSLPCLQNFDTDLRNYPYKIYGEGVLISLLCSYDLMIEFLRRKITTLITEKADWTS